MDVVKTLDLDFEDNKKLTLLNESRSIFMVLRLIASKNSFKISRLYISNGALSHGSSFHFSFLKYPPAATPLRSKREYGPIFCDVTLQTASSRRTSQRMLNPIREFSDRSYSKMKHFFGQRS